ncbi:MAG: (2Fe-2S)-binding protein, partial [Pseudonocardiales bacterium]|nr:(2Fe-2S)-binding protein [Pseudonocardiales bacterium]
MRVTGLGHASMLIETEFGSILTDPWVNPAYFGSWFPFPDNSQLDWDAIGQADYLFVSHLHRDHFDPEHLAKHVNKDATVLLPAFPTSELRDRLQELGFYRFVQTASGEVVDLDGLQIMVQALISPTDGPIGDSALWVSDGTTTLLNQNDARPSDLTAFEALGPVNLHLLQFSGAIWFPMVYELPARAKEALGQQKRERQFDRTLRYIDDLKADYVLPIAGPPCFLDEELWRFNDIFEDPANIFPDQMVFLDQMRANGHDRGLLMIPGSTAEFSGAQLDSHQHPMPTEEVEAIFTTGKADYIADYAARMEPVLAAEKAGWAPAAGESLLEPLRTVFEPIMLASDEICDGIGYPVELVIDSQQVVLDFPKRTVR